MKKFILSMLVFALITASIFYLMRSVYTGASLQADSYSSVRK